MTKNLIPIELTEINYDYEKLLNNDFSVILGSPGSGKTTLAESLAKKFNGKFININEFMYKNIKDLVSDIDNLLIIDGFDEFRISHQSKYNAIYEFILKLGELLKQKKFKVILTCRELDWYGDSDAKAIKELLSFEHKTYYIKPLNKKNLIEYVKNRDFINKEFLLILIKKDLITTPQLLVLAKELNNQEINNKIDLYYEYVIKAIKELNVYHKENDINISNDEKIEYLGYLAYFNIFGGVENFDDEILSEISSEKYKYEILEKLVKTNIFKNQKFIHKTMAEFLCGNYFANLLRNNELDKVLIINRFKYKKFIYTELRGTFAWLCGISEDYELIKVDPFYQLIYGENNHFSINFKKKIIKAIKEYSKTNPYFLHSDSYSLKDELKGFYVSDEDFDRFLMKEFNEAINNKNHYIYVFEMIFTSNEEYLSNKLKNFLFEKIFDNNLNINVKNKLLKSKIFNIKQKKEILNAIKDGKIKDKDNTLKVTLLNILYENLSNEEIIEIFKLFEPSNVMHFCWFLYELKFERKKELVLLFEKEILKDIRTKYDVIHERWSCLYGFVEQFYYEFFHTKSAKEIYEFLKQVRVYYEKYIPIPINKGYIKTDITERNEEELQRIANELFKYYFNDLNSYNSIYAEILHFYEWFPLAVPTNISEVILNKINEVKDKNIQKDMFFVAMQYWGGKKNKFEKTFKPLAEKLGFIKEYEKFLNPPKSDYEKEQEEIDKKLEKEKKETIQKNNEFFKQLTKDKFLKHFGALDFIAYLIIFEKDVEEYLEISLFNRMKGYYQDFIFSGNFLEFAEVKQIAKDFSVYRKVDIVFYVGLCMSQNKKKELLQLGNNFLKYLYIVALRESRVYSNCNSEWFIKLIEKEKSKLAKEAIMEFINEVFDLKNEIKQFLQNQGIQHLKDLFFDLLHEKNFSNSIIRIFGFQLPDNLLEKLEETKLLKIFIKFKKNEMLNENELKEFYINMFDKLSRNIAEKFNNLSREERLLIFKNFILVFYDESKMPFFNGVQSDLDITRSFARDHILNLLKEEEIEVLLKNNISDYWTNRLKWKLSQIEENKNYKKFRIKELKEFIENKGLLNDKDFFEYVSLKMDNLIQEIEANEDNQIKMFWDLDKPKNENDCRDVFVNLFKNTDFYIVDREHHIGDNRVDFEIESKIHNWKLRVECKKDSNRELYTNIQTQLIGKYLEKKLVNFGIYLIFNFGKKSKKYIKSEIERNLPPEWKNKIKIKILNLQK